MRLLLTTFLAALIALPASAACYSANEAEAEQGLRIHSELMQLGLNCMGIMRDPNLYAKYRLFTHQNRDLIDGWERTMISHLGGETAFHDFRTRMANQISSDAARQRPDVFCHNNYSRIDKALLMDKAQVRSWAATPAPNIRPSQPLCASAATAARR